eukprot:m.339126 g.339126  ORF g.339126 m.339126 type:complete len:410 (-) comp18677_c0_seq1:295-1524(-)
MEFSIYGDPEDEMVKPADVYEPLEDKSVTNAEWFHGVIDRERTEELLTKTGLPGNFLVRQRKGSKTIFVHCYVSQSKAKVVHNLVEFRKGKEVLVDNRPFSAVSLEDVVMKIQTRLKNWRNIVEYVSQNIVREVKNNWQKIYRPNLGKAETGQYLLRDPVGAFVIRESSDREILICVKRTAGNPHDLYQAMIAESRQAGFYLKFSELVGKDLPELIQIMMVNPERCRAMGMPSPLRIPQGDSSGPPPPSMKNRPPLALPTQTNSAMPPLQDRPPMALPTQNQDPEETFYGDEDDAQAGGPSGDEVLYGDLEDGEYEGMPENLSDDPPPPLPSRNAGPGDMDRPPRLPERSDSPPPPLPPGRPAESAPPRPGYGKPLPPPPPQDDDDVPPPLPPPIRGGSGGPPLPPRNL